MQKGIAYFLLLWHTHGFSGWLSLLFRIYSLSETNEYGVAGNSGPQAAGLCSYIL